jgi:hypothetical protein
MKPGSHLIASDRLKHATVLGPDQDRRHDPEARMGYKRKPVCFNQSSKRVEGSQVEDGEGSKTDFSNPVLRVRDEAKKSRVPCQSKVTEIINKVQKQMK